MTCHDQKFNTLEVDSTDKYSRLDMQDLRPCDHSSAKNLTLRAARHENVTRPLKVASPPGALAQQGIASQFLARSQTQTQVETTLHAYPQTWISDLKEHALHKDCEGLKGDLHCARAT